MKFWYFLFKIINLFLLVWLKSNKNILLVIYLNFLKIFCLGFIFFMVRVENNGVYIYVWIIIKIIKKSNNILLYIYVIYIEDDFKR